MIKYKTIKECAIDYICKEGDKLSNKQIAEKVKIIMGSNTTDKSIAWYKNKINKGIIKIDKANCVWGNKNLNNTVKGVVDIESEEEVISNEAEQYVFELEKERTGQYPKKMNNNDGPGYDFDSGDRHIEVKGVKKKNKTSLHLTANETNALIKDPKYYLYLVEGDLSREEEIDVYMIPKDDLLAMAQMKIQARLTRLSNQDLRKNWKY